MNTNENSYNIITSLISDNKEFNKEKILVYFDFNTLRNFNCEKENVKISSSNGIKLEKIKAESGDKAGKCFINVTATKEGIFINGDTIKLSFICSDCYTSDVGVSVEANSAYYGKKSRFTNNITLTNGLVMKGNDFSKFYFELIPSVFDDLTQSNRQTKYGYRVANFLSPEVGSTTEISSIYLKFNVNIEVQFTVSFQAILTEISPKFGFYGYIGIVLGALNGFVAGVAILLKIFETIYFKFKNKGERTISEYQIYIQQQASLVFIEDEKVKENENENEKSVIKDNNDHLNKNKRELSIHEQSKLVRDAKDYQKTEENEKDYNTK